MPGLLLFLPAAPGRKIRRIFPARPAQSAAAAGPRASPVLDLRRLLRHIGNGPVSEDLMGILNTLLRTVTWWNGQTLNTQFYTWRKGQMGHRGVCSCERWQ